MNSMNYPRIVIKKGREIPLLHGHPWMFSGALARADKGIEPGQVVLATNNAGQPLALGFFNYGDIAFRVLTEDVSAIIDQDFWRRRIREALALRMKIIPPDTDAFRLVNAEGDKMPGLVVDRYRDCLVFSIGTAGIERWRDAFIELLAEETGAKTIYERSEGRSRKLEGLAERVGLVVGEAPEAMEILENGLRFEVDIQAGQKTGFFLDQRVSRELVGRLSKGASVLNCFSYTGAFSIYAARGGAKRVVSVESSTAANDIAVRNFCRNGFNPELHPILTADCFEFLRQTTDQYDVIILDPPAFAKSRKDLNRAAHGYKEINMQAARRLAEGGLLATFSCSNHIDEELFGKIVLGAVRDAGKTAQLLCQTSAGPDHPVNLAHSEGRYLKGLLLCLTAQ
ncbi:MAG: class I SAM-dependent rRNA methyltransferase [Syntrophales bacterium]